MTKRSLIGISVCGFLLLPGVAGFWLLERGQHYQAYADGRAVGTVSIGRDLKIHLPNLDGLRGAKRITLVVDDSAIWGTVHDILHSLLAASIRSNSFVIKTGAGPQAEIAIPSREALAASMPGTWFVGDFELFRKMADPIFHEYSTDGEVVNVLRVAEDGALYEGYSTTPVGTRMPEDEEKRRGCVSVCIPQHRDPNRHQRIQQIEKSGV